MATEKKKFNIGEKCLKGGIAGITGVIVVFPLDLCKTRLQSQETKADGSKQYSSLLNCFRKTIQSEGYFGMYKGSAVNLILVTPEKAIKLAGNDYFRYHLTPDDGYLSIPRQILAGGLAGFFQVSITTPMELLKIQMQDQGRLAALAQQEGRDFQKTTALKITKQLLKERGITGLYKGVVATLCRDVTFSMIFFPMFSVIADLGPRKNETSKDPIFYWSLLCGLISGSCSALLVTPFDVVKTRLQSLKRGPHERVVTSIPNAFATIAQYEGFTAFFKGGACRMMVIAPLFGIAQMVYLLF